MKILKMQGTLEQIVGEVQKFFGYLTGIKFYKLAGQRRILMGKMKVMKHNNFQAYEDNIDYINLPW